MIAEENSKPAHGKTAATPPTTERAGEGVKANAATAATMVAASVAPDGRATHANGARPAYVPARRRSRRNRLL